MRGQDPFQMDVQGPIVHLEARAHIDLVARYRVDVVLVDLLEVQLEVPVQDPVHLERVHHEVVRQDQLAVPQVQDEINR